MLYIGFFKRIIPFVLTFAAGLFLASFFVSVVPNFENWRDARRTRCRDRQHQQRIEMDELREKVRTLRRENDSLRRNAADVDPYFQDAVPPVVLEAHPPTPPKRPKHPRHDVLPQ
ncbi:MAG TPA: hypothetical protein VFZ23_14750 [Pyrinomonadaceae bacterium]